VDSVINGQIHEVNMSDEEILKIVNALADGVDPITGEEFPSEHICQQIKVVRALNIVRALIQHTFQKNSDSIQPLSEDSLVKEGVLVEELKRWRLEKAKDLNWSPDYVMHNVVLFRIATTLPSNLNQLIQINGIGESKLERFGDELIEILRKHIENPIQDEKKSKQIMTEDQDFDPHQRIENECLDCGCEIQEARIEKHPDVLRCVGCQTLYEQNNPDSVRRKMKVEEGLVGSRDDHKSMRGKVFGDIRRRKYE